MQKPERLLNNFYFCSQVGWICAKIFGAVFLSPVSEVLGRVQKAVMIYRKITGGIDLIDSPEHITAGIDCATVFLSCNFCLSRGDKLEKSYLCQLINDENQEASKGFAVPNVQQLLENSFFQAGVKLNRVGHINSA